MINVIAVDSIRTLTFSAVYGFSLVFFYALQPFFSFFQPLGSQQNLEQDGPIEEEFMCG